MSNYPERGEVYIVDLDPTKGSEQGKERPGIVLQNNTGNKYSPTTILAPITSSYEEPYPVNVEIKSENSCLDKDSVVLLNQLRTVSAKHRLKNNIGRLSERNMDRVEEAIRISLGLE
ncbi:MAG: type II toxin-antitoxin system PemK/MazF family toxin [Candidatus Nanohaloarchaea archaeon]